MMRNSPPTFHSERVLFDPSQIGVGRVPLVGHYHYKSAHPPLLAHAHEGVLEICFLERGRQIYAFPDGELRCLRGGEVLVVQPGEVHGTGRLPEFPGRLHWLQLQLPGTDETLLGLSVRETKLLVAELRKLPRQFQANAHLKTHFEGVFAAAQTPLKELAAVLFRSSFLQLLFSCLNSAAQGEQSSLPFPIARALKKLSDNSLVRVKVEEMAAAGHLSESYFKILFRRSMGLPPAEFLRILRLEHAQLDLRKSNRSITEIALNTGFSSSQHFATAFRKQFGCTPVEFREKRTVAADESTSFHGAGISFHPVAVK